MAISLTELLESAIDFLETSEIYDFVLPFLLVFILIYAILQKVDLFGPGTKKINAIIAIVVGLLLVRQGDLVEFINTYLPNVSAVIIVFLGFLILLGLFGFGIGKFKGGVMVVFVIISLIGGIWALTQATEDEDVEFSIFGWDIDVTEEDAGALLVIGVLILFIGVALKEPQKRGFEGFIDGMGRIGDVLGGQQQPRTPM